MRICILTLKVCTKKPLASKSSLGRNFFLRLEAGFQRLLGDGSQWGINLGYAVQPKPEGLAQAFIIGEEFIGDDKVALVLGDNIFYGAALDDSLRACTDPDGGIVFAYKVSDPERYGVVEFDDQNQVCSSSTVELMVIERRPHLPLIFSVKSFNPSISSNLAESL